MEKKLPKLSKLVIDGLIRLYIIVWFYVDVVIISFQRFQMKLQFAMAILLCNDLMDNVSTCNILGTVY